MSAKDLVGYDIIYTYNFDGHYSEDFNTLCNEVNIQKIKGWHSFLEIKDENFEMSKSELSFAYGKMANVIMPLYRFKYTDNLFYAQIALLESFGFWFRFFKENNINYVVANMPVYIDTAMHYVAEFIGITVYTISPMALQPDNSSLFYAFDEMKQVAIPIGSGSVKLDEVIFPLQKNKPKKRNSIFTNSVLKTLALTIIKGRLFRFLFILNEVRIYSLLRIHIQKLYKKTYLDLSNKYVYYSLHFDPEMNTMPYEEMYANQLLNIRILSASLPEDWILYVKDHPQQHSFSHMSHHSEKYLIDLKYYRDTNFYNYLTSLKNVRLVDHTTDQVSLVKNAMAVASIKGTVFLEASYYSKPILVFGKKTPYRYLKNAYCVFDVPSCKKAMHYIEDLNGEMKSDIGHFLNKFTVLANIHHIGDKDKKDISNFMSKLINFIQHE